MDTSQAPLEEGQVGAATYDRIVVPLDGSDLATRAIPVAEDLARLYHAELRYLTVDPRGDRDFGTVDGAVLEALGSDDVPTHPLDVASSDDVAAALVGVAEAQGTLLCMSTHGRGAFFEAVLGSVAKDVVRDLTSPVVLVGPHFDAESWGGLKRLVVSVDGSPLSEAILPVVAGWVQALGIRLDLVHVLPEAVPDLERLEATAPGDVNESAYLHRVADDLKDQGVDAQWDVLHGGHVADSIVDYVERTPSTMVALTTHGRTGLARVVLGNVAGRLAKLSPSPLLVLRPADLRED